MSVHKPEIDHNVGPEQAGETSVMNSQQNYEKIGVRTLDKASVYSNYDYKKDRKDTAGDGARGKTICWIAALVGSGVVLGGVVLICLVLGAIGVGRQSSGGIRCTVEEASGGEFAPYENTTSSGPLLLMKEVHTD